MHTGIMHTACTQHAHSMHTACTHAHAARPNTTDGARRGRPPKPERQTTAAEVTKPKRQVAERQVDERQVDERQVDERQVAFADVGEHDGDYFATLAAIEASVSIYRCMHMIDISACNVSIYRCMHMIDISATLAHTHMHVHTCAYTHAHTHMRAHTHAHTCMPGEQPTSLRAWRQRC